MPIILESIIMTKRYLPCVLGLAASLALSGAAALAQDDAQANQPASLSSNLLMDDELAPKEEDSFVIDPAILTPPENATADELLEFIESLQDKLPQPTSQEQLYKLVDAFSQTSMTVADKILAMSDLTPEQKERAVQLKVVSLTTRANVDPTAAEELNKFVDQNIKDAATGEEKIKAYQLKLQVLAASEEDPTEKINALAEEALQLEEEELQLFAIEVKANAFITSVQKTGEFNENILTFVQGIIDDEMRAIKVKEKALEMKLVALIVGSEVAKEKAGLEAEEEDSENADKQQDKAAEYVAQADKLFDELLKGDFSMDLKKSVYQLRVQSLLQAEKPDQAKIDAVIADLLAQEDEELYALGVAVKGQTLLNAAMADKEAVPALTEYAKQIVEEAKTKKNLTTQSIGLMIQSYRLQDDLEGLLQYVDAKLAETEDETMKPNLLNVKVSVISQLISKDPALFDQYKDFLETIKNDEQFGAAVSQIYMARFRAAIADVAANESNLEKYNAAIEQFKTDLTACPRAITGLLMVRQDIDAIGKANNNEKLFDETFDSIIDFCKTSDSEELNSLAQNLEVYLTQMRQAEAAAAEQAAKEAEEKAAEKAEKETEDKAAEKTEKATDNKAAKPVAKADSKKPAAKAPAAKTPAKKSPAKAAEKK